MLSPQAFDHFVAPARLRPQLWRLLIGLAVLAVIYFSWIALMGAGAWLALGSTRLEQGASDFDLGATPVSLVLLLFSFIGMALGVFAAARFIHHRSIASLFGPREYFWRDFSAGAGVFVLFSIPAIIYFLTMADLDRGVPWSVWFLFLPLVVVGLLIQTGAEELVFRGYLQQQLAARFASRWAWMVLPSVLFGLVHYAPEQMGSSTWLIIFVTGFFGLLLADLTARSGSLGMAWGLHFTNNLIAICLFTTGEALDGMALYRLPFGPSDTNVMQVMLAIDMAGMVVVWAVCRWWLRGR